VTTVGARPERAAEDPPALVFVTLSQRIEADRDHNPMRDAVVRLERVGRDRPAGQFDQRIGGPLTRRTRVSLTIGG
jgi:hypothetical protein